MKAVKLFSEEEELLSFCWLICFLVLEGNSRRPAATSWKVEKDCHTKQVVLSTFGPSILPRGCFHWAIREMKMVRSSEFIIFCSPWNHADCTSANQMYNNALAYGSCELHGQQTEWSQFHCRAMQSFWYEVIQLAPKQSNLVDWIVALFTSAGPAVSRWKPSAAQLLANGGRRSCSSGPVYNPVWA